MANSGEPSPFAAVAAPSDFNTGETGQEFSVGLKDSMILQGNKLAEHEGKISGLISLVAALQSYKGFLQAAILAVGALLLAAIAVLFNLQLSAAGRADKGIDGISSRLSVVETKVDALPGRLSTEIREASRDMAILTRPTVSSPPTILNFGSTPNPSDPAR